MRMSTLRGAFSPDAGIADEVAAKIKRELDKFGLANQPLGVDVIELPIAPGRLLWAQF